MNSQKVFKGICFIGDPHLTEKRMGRRKDNFLETALYKLRFILKMCQKEELFPVCLGDLFDKSKEVFTPLALEKIATILYEFKNVAGTTFPVLVGNHDLSGKKLREGDVLHFFKSIGIVRPLFSEQDFFDVHIKRGIVRIIPTGYGNPVFSEYHDLTVDENNENKISSILITHHDLAIPPYNAPNAIEPFEIGGIDHVINGHDHTAKPTVKAGNTFWHNPGNISRLKINEEKHVPGVYIYNGFEFKHQKIPYSEEVFDKTGFIAPVGGTDDAIKILIDNLNKNEDAAIMNTEDNYLINLLNEVVNKKNFIRNKDSIVFVKKVIEEIHTQETF